MSEKDPLKSIFDSAFAQESIAFDPKGWEQMETALNATPKKRLGFLWLFSGIALVAAGMGITMLNSNMAATYEPRVGMAIYGPIDLVDPINSDQLIQSDLATDDKNQTNTQNSNAGFEPSKSANEETKTTINTTSTAAATASADVIGSSSTEAPEVAVGPTEPIRTDDPAINGSSLATTSAPALAGTIAPSASPERQTEVKEDQPSLLKGQSTAAPATLLDNREMLGSMEFLSASPLMENNEQDLVTQAIENDDSQKRQIKFYGRIGVVKTANTKGLSGFDGFGQTIGAGVEWRAKPHFLLSTELNIYREKVRYELTQNSEQYGFFQTEESLLMNVSDLISFEVPLMAHYRYNRWTAGAGLSAQILASSKITETYSQSGTADFTPTSTQTFEGYARWSEMARVNVNLPVQVIYRFQEAYFVGARYRYGFNDLFKMNGVVDRKTGFEIFLRMNF